jgi:hypothetical protein
MKRFLVYAMIFGGGLTLRASAQSHSEVKSNHSIDLPSVPAISQSHQKQAYANDLADSSSSGSEGILAVGAVIGTPSGVSFMGGYYFKNFAVRLSGGSWGKEWNGFQGDLSYNLTRSSSFSTNVSLIGGQYGNTLKDVSLGESVKRQRYWGLAYDVYLSGFFLQTGVGFGSGDYPSPQFLFQCGYLIEL